MYRVTIEHRGPVPGSANLTQREWNAVVREAWRQCGLLWISKFRQKHFTSAGGTEYGYLPRVGERGNFRHWKYFKQTYTGRKLKTKGHTRPLTYSGDTERATRAARAHAVATRNRSGVEVIMRAPTLNRKHAKSQIKMRDEMVRISPREAQEILRLHRRFCDSQLRAIRKVTTKTH